MDNLWIVVAHRGGVRIFSRNRPSEGLKLIESWDDPAGRLQDRDMGSDRPGRTFSPTPSSAMTGKRSARYGPRRSGYDPIMQPHEVEALRFSQEIARHLQEGRNHNRYFRLILVAGPEEMGLLNQVLDKATLQTVIATVNKNLSYFKDSEIEDHIFDALDEVDEKLIMQRSA